MAIGVNPIGMEGTMTKFSFAPEGRRKKSAPADGPYQRRVVSDLRCHLLPLGGTVLEIGENLIMVAHHGKVGVLQMRSDQGKQSNAFRGSLAGLRDAGVRVEVAYAYKGAIELIRQMGIPLRKIEDTAIAVRELFKSETRRRTA